jgi:serine/threonine protein phosphatase PrpC
LDLSGYDIKIGNATDVGKVREHNEDYMAHFDTPIGYCIILCDGMGGHVAGQVAAQNSIVSIQRFLTDLKHDNSSVPMVLYSACGR